jgi:hypothetical protein
MESGMVLITWFIQTDTEQIKQNIVDSFNNFTIISFLTEQHNIEYDYYAAVIKALIPKNELLGKSMPVFLEQPFKNIISIENLFKTIPNKPTSTIEILSICYQIPTEEIEPVGIFEFYTAFNFVHNSYNKLIERENKVLHYDPEPEELEAGIESLSKFGRMATVDTLAGGDLLKHNQIIEMPYSRVFTKMYLESEKAKYQRKLIAIKSKKSPE